MEKLKQLEQNVIQWADDRGFFGKGGATLFGQYLKLREEFGELSGNFAKGRCMKDDIGDVAVVVIIMNRLNGDESIFVREFNDSIDYFRDRHDLKLKYAILDGCINRMMMDSNGFQYKLDAEKTPMILVILSLIAEDKGLNLTECLEHAYNEIKDRKGKWINNVFVKESDLTGE